MFLEKLERKSKYRLFPAKPSPTPREPSPSLPKGSSRSQGEEDQGPLQDSPTRPSSETFHSASKDRQSQAARLSASTTNPPFLEIPPTEEPPSSWLPLNNSWSPREETSSTLNENPTPTEGTSSKRKMPKMQRKLHVQSSSTSPSSSESSLHKPTNPPNPPLPLNPRIRTRPRTVYFHSGIGGAGNYHKAIREDNVLRPMSRDRDASNQPRFLSSLFGTLGGKRNRRQCAHYSSGDDSGSAQSSGETLPLGAAEVMRRKMLGFALDGKTKESGTRG